MVRRTPFQPFIVELTSGNQLTVDHPEALVFRTTIAVHFDRSGVPTLFDNNGVVRLIGTADFASVDTN